VDNFAEIFDMFNSLDYVDARSLHVFLKPKTIFNSWIVRRLKKHRLREKTDYVIARYKPIGGGAYRIDYHLTPDAAKKIALTESTVAGKIVRDYFIMCEKKLYN
jgi:anti-repressor protein